MDTTALAVIGVLTIIRAINISSRNAAFLLSKNFFYFFQKLFTNIIWWYIIDI